VAIKVYPFVQRSACTVCANDGDFRCVQGTVFDVTGNAAYAPGKNYSGTSIYLTFRLSWCHDRVSTTSLRRTDLQFHATLTWIELCLCSFFANTVFTGREPNRALGLSSLKPEDCVPEWEDLDETGLKTLNDWFTFFSKRYNVVGKVQRDAAPASL
jgi:hypothetical protein